MAFSGTGLMPIDQALAFLLDQQASLPSKELQIEEVPVADALGRFLAEEQIAMLDVPAHDNSAMDGYAVNSADLSGDGVQLKVSQTIAAGYVGDALEPGTAVRIFTGAPIPQGADVVVIQENTSLDSGIVTINESPDKGRNIRRKGHDIAIGDKVLAAGHRLKPQDLGLLSSLGISKIKVQKALTVAIINTGDEIIPPEQELGPGQIYDSNSFTLAALLQTLGFKTLKLGIVADDLASTERALSEAADQADCIISTGGVSVGDEDHVKTAVENLGELSLWKLAIKPGKPFSYGMIEGKPFFGLPGNPVAVFVTFTMLVRPYLLKMLSANEVIPRQFKIRAGFAIKKSGSRQEYIRVRLGVDEKGEQALVLFGNQGSSILTSLSWADGLAIIPIDSTVTVGDLVDYIPFNGLY